jgi:signal transduction histidine kinase
MATVVAPAAESPAQIRRVLTLVGVTLAGAIACAVTVWAAAASTILVQPESTAVFRGLYVASAVSVGIYTWWRRPQSPLGPLLAGSGLLHALTAFNTSADERWFTLGMVVWAFWIAYIAYLFLSFPRGRLSTRAERGFMLAYALATAVVWALAVVFADTLPRGGPFTYCGSECPGNGFQLVETDAAVSDALRAASNATLAVSLVAVAFLIFAKARSSVRLQRRAIEPLAYLFIATIAVFLLALLLAPVYPDSRQTFRILNAVLILAGPFVLLAGQIRGSMFATRSLGQLVARIGNEPVGPAGVQGMLREALGDPTLQLALWSPERAAYTDSHGDAIELPLGDPDRAATPIVRGGQPVAALIHDTALDEAPELLGGLTATSLMLLDNTRLVEDLRASRARIVAAAEQERLRLERDLHDGAQQRLMAIQIKLALARDDAETEELGAQLDEIAEDAASAVEELRQLAHGIYPTILRERGLGEALGAFAASFPLDVTVLDEGVGRASPELEAAVYFCSLEAVQNVVKHAGPGTPVTLTLERRAGRIACEIVDDGDGFDPRGADGGVGLVSMRDRIGAVGGELEIVSQPGRGTTVRMLVPEGPSA